MGMLDGLLYGLNSDSGPDYRGLNPDAGDLSALDKVLKPDPYAELDKKAREEAARKAALGVFDTGAPAVPASGISGQQAMTVGPYGSIAPQMPQAAPLAPPIAPGSPAPALPPAQTIAPPPAVASPQADPAALPENATPTVGSGDPAAAVPETSLLGRLGKGLSENSNLLLSLGAGMAGAPSFGTGLSRGFQMAVPGSQLDQKMVNQNSTVQALMKRGLPADVAQAAATNPTILQQILPQVFGAKQRKFTQIGEDMTGNKQFGFVDEASGKTYDLQGNAITGASGGTTIPTGADGQPLQGQELLAHLEKTSPQAASEVKAMIAGNAANTRNVQKLAPLAHLVDPNFDESQYPVRLAARKSYTSGKDFQELQALNTVGGHLGKLADSAGKLGNSNIPVWNGVQNWFADHFTGSPALVKFRNDLVTTSNELAKAYHGGHVSDSAYSAFNKAVNEAQTPAEMKAAIGELAGLLDSKIAAKESGYKTSMSAAPLPEEYRALNDEAKHSFQKINDWANGSAGATGSMPRVSSPAEAAKLPKGTRFVDSNGVERVVP